MIWAALYISCLLKFHKILDLISKCWVKNNLTHFVFILQFFRFTTNTIAATTNTIQYMIKMTLEIERTFWSKWASKLIFKSRYWCQHRDSLFHPDGNLRALCVAWIFIYAGLWGMNHYIYTGLWAMNLYICWTMEHESLQMLVYEALYIAMSYISVLLY